MTKKIYFVFGDKINRQRHIRIENYMIEILIEFKYLGFIFNKNRKFSFMYVVNQARKALFGLYSKIRNLDISIACQLKLFDNLVVPILTYGCEICCSYFNLWLRSLGFWGLVRYRKGSDRFFKTNSQSKTKHTISNAIWRFRLCTIINKY